MVEVQMRSLRHNSLIHGRFLFELQSENVQLGVQDSGVYSDLVLFTFNTLGLQCIEHKSRSRIRSPTLYTFFLLSFSSQQSSAPVYPI